ncbi:uncharacterized protein LOC117315264 [Pecten maximus]|uniref:uncharacterized protein LOC117315264 n=1 Tax=Pecten maximus TaxID=6579 RepID=UPI001458ED10|nr:uncharacterized protein LOC117315264 [Pecten maximus]
MVPVSLGQQPTLVPWRLSAAMKRMVSLVNTVQSQNLPERFINVSACYSKRIGPSCFSGEVIAIDAVYVGAKKLSSSCQLVTSLNQVCCERDTDNDCITTYLNEHNNLTYTYHDECIGQEVCSSQPVQWMTVAPDWCTNHTQYLPNTNYMVIDYYCINKTNVGVLPSVSLVASAGSALYLQGQQYPGYMTQATYSSCSLKSSCGGGVSIQAIHIEFDMNDGICQQEITISDTSGHTRVITCDDNNNYNISEVFTTSSHNITINVCSRHGNGKFWIGFVRK